MPSLEEVPENGRSTTSIYSNWEKYKTNNKCICCPYGFHIDVEFVQFSQSLLSREGDVKRVQALKDKWRSERQSMDQLLGANGTDSRRSSHSERRNNWNHASSIRNNKGHFLTFTEQVHSELKLIGDDEPFDNGLEAAEAEFDLALDRVRESNKGLSYEMNDNQKFHTFPRIKAPVSRKLVNESPIVPKRDSSQRISVRELILMNEEFINKERRNSSEKENGTDSHDGNVIEELQEKIRALTRENWKLKCEKLAAQDSNEKEKLVRNTLTQLEPQEINELRSNAVVEKRRTRDACVEAVPKTRDVGVSKIAPVTRSIGVGGIGITESIYMERSRREEPSSPTGSLTGTLRRRVRTFDVGVQINDCDLREEESSPLLQIVERVDSFTQTALEVVPVQKRSKEVGSWARAKTFDVGMTVKPEVHSTMSGSDLTTKSIKVQTEEGHLELKIEEVTEDTEENVEQVQEVPVTPPAAPEPEPMLNTPPSSTDDVLMPTETIKHSVVQKDTSKFKPKSKLPKSLFELEKYPAPLEPVIKSPSRIPRFSPSGLKSPTKQEFEWSSDSLQTTSVKDETPSPVEKPVLQRSDTYTKEIDEFSDKSRSPTPRRQKAVPSKEMQGALKVLNDALLRGRTTQNVTSAIGLILHEWFRVSGTKTANPHDVEDYLDDFENYSPQILRYIVNMPDGNGNTAMHYAVSHGNFDVVSILLDSRVCDPNKANKAGYTSVMLVALAKVVSDTHRHVVRRLFSMGDVNTKAAQHGQTALMLAASHGRLDTVKLLLEAGAEINLQDEDGSTALMCASEHGHAEIVRYLLAMPECNPNLTDNDGSTALTVAMEAGNKDIGVLLYAHMNFPESPSDSSPGRTASDDTNP